MAMSAGGDPSHVTPLIDCPSRAHKHLHGDCGRAGGFATRAEKVAFVRGDQDVDFEYVAGVIDTAGIAGVEPVGLMGEDQ